MESAFAWIGKIAEFFGSLFPRLLIVKSSHCAVKYVHGYKRVLLEPGLHLYWPLVTEYEICAVVRQIVALASQVLETKDGVTVLVDGLVVYEIDDAETFLADNENAYQSIDDVASAAVRKVIISLTYAEIRAGRARLDGRLTRATQTALRPFGVDVEYVRLTNFAKTRVLHVSGGPLTTVENHQGNQA